MQHKIFSFFAQLIIFCNEYNIIVQAIVGNNVTEADDSKFSCVVCIVVKKNNISNGAHQIGYNLVCTGTLISVNHVLTAGHCGIDLDCEKVQIIAGSTDIRRGIRYNIMWWITHNQWAQALRKRTRYITNDISIIKTIEFVPNTVVPAVLSIAKRKSLFGSTVVTAGWGMLSSGEIPNILHTATLTIISDQDCLQVSAKFGHSDVFISQGQVCSIARPFALLECGDSGGPLLIGNTIVAVNIGTCPDFKACDFHPDLANLHASVYYYRNFIKEIKEN